MKRSATRLVSTATALVAAAALVGCSCSQSRYCDVDPGRPPFGTAWVRLYHNVTGLPQWTTHEFAERGAELDSDAHAWTSRCSEDAAATEENVAAFPGAVRADFDYHGAEMAGFFGRQSDRFQEDSCCFLQRAWHVIKLGIE
jgi:hypothetical protein